MHRVIPLILPLVSPWVHAHGPLLFNTLTTLLPSERRLLITLEQIPPLILLLLAKFPAKPKVILVMSQYCHFLHSLIYI